MKIKEFNIVFIALLLNTVAFSQKQPQEPGRLPKELILPEIAIIKDGISIKSIKIDPKIVANGNSFHRKFGAISGSGIAIPFEDVPLTPEPATGDINSVEKSKSVVREFKVDGNDKLAIENSFGNVIINTWKKNEFKVEVEIKAYEDSEEKAEELLNTVSINSQKQGSIIKFVTEIERKKERDNWWGIRKNNGVTERRGVQVNYTVYMPAKNALEIENKYGNITLPELSGILSINSSYGSLKGDKLLNPSNKIKVSYGNAMIAALSSANLQVSYGKLILESADKLDANVSYSSAKIGKLSGDGALTLRYCRGFKIDEVDKKIKTLNVSAAYSSVSLGFEPTASFDFDVTVSYCGFNYPQEKVVVLTRSPDEGSRGVNFTKNFKGQIGKGSDAKVVVNSRYGSVDFH